MFGLGIGIIVLVLLVSLLVAHRSNSYSLYQILFGMFLGLLLASVAPGLPNSMNQFVHSVQTSLSHIHYGN